MGKISPTAVAGFLLQKHLSLEHLIISNMASKIFRRQNFGIKTKTYSNNRFEVRTAYLKLRKLQTFWCKIDSMAFLLSPTRRAIPRYCIHIYEKFPHSLDEILARQKLSPAQVPRLNKLTHSTETIR